MSIRACDEEEVGTLSELIAYYETCNRAKGESHKTVGWYSTNLISPLGLVHVVSQQPHALEGHGISTNDYQKVCLT